ncbi:MAG: CinA family protein [Campylobacterota bacterium]|nr:CinA family protein [Campylobacterota bacterium]
MNYINVENIIKKLVSQNQTISFSESCTGGRITAAFTAISGASAVLNGSMVTYSNDIKHSWLGVENEVLENYGAVSSECIVQMLAGIQKATDSDYALAVSGVAGPTGGSDEKPVGTVYIGLLTPTSQEVFHCLFDGDRSSIQEQSTAFAIRKLDEYLKI